MYCEIIALTVSSLALNKYVVNYSKISLYVVRIEITFRGNYPLGFKKVNFIVII